MGPQCWNLELEARIRALRLEFRPGGWDLGLGLGFWPGGRDLGLEAEILALRLKFEPGGWGLGLKTGIWALRMGFWPKGLGGGVHWRRRRRRRRRRNFPCVKA